MRPPGLLETVVGLGERTDVYIGCAPRRQRHGGKAAIENVWTLWVDIDGPGALAALQAFRPLPAIVIRSGSPDSVHAYWPLREPLRPAQAEEGNRRLAQHLGADQRAVDAARILRPAETLNHKLDPPAAVECVRLEVGRQPTAAEVLADVPVAEPTDQGVAATRVRPLQDYGDDPLRTIPAAEYVPALTGHAVGRDRKARCPFHAGGGERTPSLHAYDGDDGAGWYCFACEAGGSIIDFGARLYGIEPRGSGYHEVRRRLAADLLRSEVVA